MCQVDDGAGGHDPNGEKEAPEVVVDCHRVLQTEDEEVPDNNDRVEEEQRLRLERVLQEHLDRADLDRKRAEQVSDVVGAADDESRHRRPRQRREELVHQSPLLVGAEPLEPDRAEPGDHVGGQQDAGESHGHELRRPAFENAAEVDLSGTVRVIRQIGRCHCSPIGGKMGCYWPQ